MFYACICILPASRCSSPTNRVGLRLRQRQANTPINAARNTSPTETSGNRNWNFHRSENRHESSNINKYSYINILQLQMSWKITAWEACYVLVLGAHLQVRIRSSPLLTFPGDLYLDSHCWGKVKAWHLVSIIGSKDRKIQREKYKLTSL